MDIDNRDQSASKRTDRIVKIIQAFEADECSTVGHFEVVKVGDRWVKHWSILWDREVEDLFALPEYRVAQVFAVLGNEVRIAMLRELVKEPLTIAQLVSRLQMKTTGQAHHHMKELQLAGFVGLKEGGRYHLNLKVARVYFAALALARDAGAGEESL